MAARRKNDNGGAPRVNRYSVAPFIQQYYSEYYTIETYPVEQSVAFDTIDGEWGILGNFAHTSLEVNGVTFPTSEHLFQTMKFKDEDVVKRVYQAISLKGNKANVKMAAKSYETVDKRRSDWGSMIVDVMKFCLQTKYDQIAEFRAELERTKGLYIVEEQTSRRKGRGADTWGVVMRDGVYVGPNLMGRLLMELRDNGKLEYKLPEDALDFIEYLKEDNMKRISLIMVLLAGMLAAGCCRSSQQVNNELRDELIVEYMRMLSDFYDCSLVSWDYFTELELHQNKSDWGPQVTKVMDDSWKDFEATSMYWEMLQNVKVYLHCESLPLRALTGPKVAKELDNLEAAFDKVFVEMVSQEYYMRVFQDVYDETIQPQIDRLTKTISKTLKSDR